MTAMKQVSKRQSVISARQVLNADMNESQKEWLNRMRAYPELETTTVLFAKSIAEVAKKPIAVRAPSYKKAQLSSRSISPQKSLTSIKAMSDKSSSLIRTIRIPSTSCESLARPKYRRRPSPSSSFPMSSGDSMSSSEDSDYKDRRFVQSMPSVAVFNGRKPAEAPHRVRMRPNKNTKNSGYRHTIRIGDEKADEIISVGRKFNSARNGVAIKCNSTHLNPRLVSISTTSPNSSESSSCSVDSGQCSGRGSCLIHKNSKIMSESTASSDFSSHLKSTLPSYARMAISMDHVLRTASTIYSLLETNLEDVKMITELVHKVKIYIEIVQQSPCQPFLSNEDFELVIGTIQQLTDYRFDYKDHRYLKLLDYSSVVIRRMLEQSLIVFLRITANYLNECTNKDRLLLIALEHLVHLLLFSDEFCLEAIRCKSIENIIGFCRQTTTSSDTIRLLLRVLAVLCGVSRGCVQLISIGGLDDVLHLFNTKPINCAVEAAGVLAQLTNPNHPFVRLGNSQTENIILRLIELADESHSPESLLLSTATLANFALQNAASVKILYERNAVQRLVQALNRPDNTNNIFIQEQIIIIFSQLATSNYEQALVAQGGVPVLLKMLEAEEQFAPQRIDYSKRIRYKAAVCLATIANCSFGLKAIYNNHGIQYLERILQEENIKQLSPFVLICTNMLKQLKSLNKPLESVV